MPTRGYLHPRTIRFHETDAAGVVYFANILVLCHEAFEASLAAAGIELREFFGNSDLAVPIVHTEASFRRPLYCGDEIAISVWPQHTGPETFEVSYQVIPQAQANQDPALEPRILATALTRHVCIAVATRQRQTLPQALTHWITFCQGYY